MAENDSFVFYLEWIDYLEMLPPDKAMEILKAIVGLIRDEKTVQFTDPGQNMAYSFIANQVKRDKRKYKEVVSKRAEAGRKGGLAKQANARSAKQSLANLAVNVNDNVINIPPISPKGDKPKKKPETDSFSKSFDDFWKAYPKKVSKSNALKAWKKLKPNDDLVREILSALEKQKQSSQWQKDNGQFIPYPTTWLNGKRWEDDLNTGEEESHEHNSRLYEGLL